MGKIRIGDYDAWYDETTDLIIDDEGRIRSSVPNGTFYFNGKLYTYGTKVRIATETENYIAEFKKDTEYKRVYDPFTHAIPMKETKEYFDGQPFELDDIFLEVGGSTKTYLNTSSFENNVSEIIEPVEYVNPRKLPAVKDTPPTQNGYRTLEHHSSTDPSWIRWKDHLFNCEVDVSGDVVKCYAPNTFGLGKYVYTIGTRVIIKHRIGHKNSFFVATFDGQNFVIEGYGKIWGTIGAGRFIKGYEDKDLSIVQILEPHYYKPVSREITALDKLKLEAGEKPGNTGPKTLLYVIVMIGALMFNGTIYIWIMATLLYFLWRNGYMNK